MVVPVCSSMKPMPIGSAGCRWGLGDRHTRAVGDHEHQRGAEAQPDSGLSPLGLVGD
jgi:hypothetical protein